jgi:hypothetical protein
MNLTAANNGTDGQIDIAIVAAALVANVPASHARRPPGMLATDASSAPARYPAKFADAINPAWPADNRSASCIIGRSGV